MPSQPSHIKTLFERKKILKDFFRQTNEQQKILSLVKRHLPNYLSLHCNNTVLSKAILNIYTDSPVWANKLRFEAPNLLSKLREEQLDISSISVKCNILPKLSKRKIKKSHDRNSNKASKIVESLANTTIDSKLRAALIRLSKSLKEF
tara:strand:- start:223 stop:666 length:444 start_codon:yes stop_codon:yes gene_type:complete